MTYILHTDISTHILHTDILLSLLYKTGVKNRFFGHNFFSERVTNFILWFGAQLLETDLLGNFGRNSASGLATNDQFWAKNSQKTLILVKMTDS